MITGSYKEPHSSKTGSLYTESPSGVFIIVAAMITAIISHSEGKLNHWLHNYHANASRLSRMTGWTVIWPMSVVKYFAWFFFPEGGGRLWKTFCAKWEGSLVWLVSCRISVVLAITAQWTWWGSEKQQNQKYIESLFLTLPLVWILETPSN